MHPCGDVAQRLMHRPMPRHAPQFGQGAGADHHRKMAFAGAVIARMSRVAMAVAIALLIAVAIKASMVDLTTSLNDWLEAGLASGALVFLATTAVFTRLARGAVRPMLVVSLVALVVLVVLGPQLPTAALLVAVTLAAAIGIDIRSIGLRQTNRDLPASAE